MDGKQVVDEFIKKERTTTEFDAVHPRFTTSDPDGIAEFQRRNDFYCTTCRLYFAPNVMGLKNHFIDNRMVQHRPYGSCFYCRGDVYHYTLNEQIRLYHNCNNK